MSIEELVKRRADSDVADHTAYMESCIQGLLRVSICYIMVPLRDRSLTTGRGEVLRVSIFFFNLKKKKKKKKSFLFDFLYRFTNQI